MTNDVAVRMPTFFIPHGGGPCFFMEWNPADLWKPMAEFLQGIAATVPEKPRAILLVSAHWEAAEFSVGSSPEPDLIYDYYGFPPHTYQLKYPAPGDPELAQRVAGLLAGAGIPALQDPDRGFDHGMFIPLKLIYPDADIPVIQLSLCSNYDAALHIAAGAALAPLRDEGVLIVGSGMSFHNMAAISDPASIGSKGKEFGKWLSAAVTAPAEERNSALAQWDRAPHARFAHPPRAEEHLLPLMVAAGAGGADAGTHLFTDPIMDVSGCRFG